ncbi:hypothetical protein A2V49_04270 [candidate division WWE3 bacterium RBG_19FT_COMBO_34_6]|uniref:Peptidase A24A N-terminal domain-containing protein n=1 Tax=candidate division WWE3 bacterium RBG_19FT_COMBO_34_6 TaxID=1802612 RepID=A0A1F4UNC4_UNCKA|nr:MAG: hypothetical protein A2V49_04270 [candidate division WWE3 bacterium RBG_19FT_COMBO_34_6]
MLHQIILYSLTFISGLFFGSFLNLVADRSIKGEKILIGRSKCDFCKRPLKPINLIPLLSFIIQKGKCASCKKKISFYYPLSEILTGFTFVFAALFSGIFKNYYAATLIIFVYLLIAFSFYVILFLTDMKYKLIPNRIVYPAILFVFCFLIFNTIYYFVSYYYQLKNDEFGIFLLQAGYLNMQIYSALKSFGLLLLSAFGIATFFYFLVFITKGRGMGEGDIRLGLLIGLFNGFPYNILAIFFAFVIGAIYSVILIIFGKKSIKDTIAFGPFLLISSVIILFFGSRIWQFYINLF